VNGCYKVVTRKLNWTNAGLECRSLHPDTHLLVINDAQEQSAVAGILASGSRQLTFLIIFIVSLFGPGNRAGLRPYTAVK